MPWKVCAEPGCPEFTEHTRCEDHRRLKEKARGTRQQRGYTTEHDATRTRLLPLAYGTPCPIAGPNCVGVMRPWHDLHLDHTIPLAQDNTSKGDRIVCAPCNQGRRPETE